MFEKVFNVVREALSCIDGIWYFLSALLIILVAFTVCVIVKNKEVFKYISLDIILILSLFYVISGFNVNGALALIISLTLLSSVFYSILKIVPLKEENKDINRFIKSLDDKIKRDNMLEAEEYKSILTGEDEIFVKKMKSSNVVTDNVKDVNLSHAELLTERLLCYSLS